MNIKSGIELLSYCEEKKVPIYHAAIDYEKQNSGMSEKEILDKMMISWNVMKVSIAKGLDKKQNIKGKMIGGEAKKLKEYYDSHVSVCGLTMSKAISYALSVIEVNASMGRIVACPTAGSSGVLPAVLLSTKETFNLLDKDIIHGLLTSSMVGIIIGKNASLSGAQGGCQAEVGSASAMAAAAVVEMLGGSCEQALHAASMCLKNIMGLVCDPVAGLVEVPCAKRNTIGTANAMISAEMALAGIVSIIPFDEVVYAMDRVGRMMPVCLRETAEGGVAATPTGQRLKEEIMPKA